MRTRRSWVSSAAVAALLLAACSGPSGASPGPDSSASSAASGGATTGATDTAGGTATEGVGSTGEPSAGATGGGPVTDMTYRSAAPVWWAGFEIELLSAHLDVAEHLLELEVRLTNASPVDTSLSATSGDVFVSADDRMTRRNSVGDTIPHGTTLRTMLRFQSLADDFDLATAQLVFGGEGVHRAVFVLGSRDANETALALRPRRLPGTVVISNAHTEARFEARDVRLVAAACTGPNPIDITYEPAPSDELVLELVGTIQSPSRSVGGVVAERAVATPVGGTRSIAEPGLGMVLGGDARPKPGVHLCFPLPADTHGRVDLTFDTRLVGEDFVTARGSVVLP